jgi:hypothetical protein
VGAGFKNSSNNKKFIKYKENIFKDNVV